MALEIEGVCPLMSVFDMRVSIEFYVDVLGFEIVSASGPGRDVGWALLRSNDAEIMLNTAYDDGERPPAPDPARVAAHEDTVLYFGCRDVDAAAVELRSRGVAVEGPRTAFYGMRQLYFSDPDGYRLCFQWRAPAVEP